MQTHGSAYARPAALALSLLAVGYVGLWATLAGLPFQDIPNHVARAVVIGDLLFDGGRRFGEHFAFEWQVVPYILGDLLLLPLAHLLPADVAGRLWVILEWLSLPVAVAALLRAWRAPPLTMVLGLAFSLYLATDVFFVMGFANFRLAVALTLLALAAWEMALRTSAVRWWAAYLALAAAGYLMHLSALVFLVAAVGTLSALRLLERRERFATLLAAGLPILLLLAWHVLFREVANAAPAVQPTAQAKLLRLASPLVRYRDALEIGLFVAFLIAVVTPILAASRRAFGDRQRELAALAVAFVLVYFALPEAKGAIWAIDNRALSLAWLWAALLAAWTVPALRGRRVALTLALAIAGANLAFLAGRLGPDDARMREYRALLAEVPRGAWVLSVTTQPKRGFTNPTAHAASFATIDRDAIVPYTFSGDVGMPMSYFRFRDRPRTPFQFWYQAGYPPEEGAAAFAHFPYLLVELPADWARIPVRGEVIAGNRKVALVATQPGVAVAAAASGGGGHGTRR